MYFFLGKIKNGISIKKCRFKYVELIILIRNYYPNAALLKPVTVKLASTDLT